MLQKCNMEESKHTACAKPWLGLALALALALAALRPTAVEGLVAGPLPHPGLSIAVGGVTQAFFITNMQLTQATSSCIIVGVLAHIGPAIAVIQLVVQGHGLFGPLARIKLVVVVVVVVSS